MFRGWKCYVSAKGFIKTSSVIGCIMYPPGPLRKIIYSIKLTCFLNSIVGSPLKAKEVSCVHLPSSASGLGRPFQFRADFCSAWLLTQGTSCSVPFRCATTGLEASSPNHCVRVVLDRRLCSVVLSCDT